MDDFHTHTHTHTHDGLSM